MAWNESDMRDFLRKHDDLEDLVIIIVEDDNYYHSSIYGDGYTGYYGYIRIHSQADDRIGQHIQESQNKKVLNGAFKKYNKWFIDWLLGG